MIEGRRSDAVYLPPYSPDFNPIENAFAKLKALLRRPLERTIDGLWAAIGRSSTPSPRPNAPITSPPLGYDAILDRIGPARAAALCATAGLLRWIVMAHSVWVPALALVQPLHGLTFALLHLACMRLLSHIVPPGLSATALTLYGTLGAGVSSVVLTLASGPLYGQFGSTGFWAMAGLCALATPLALTLKSTSPHAQS